VILERLRRAGTLDRFSVPAPLVLLAAAAGLALPAHLGWMKDVGLALVLFPALCAASIAGETRPNRLFAFLGLISYPLYVTHIALPYGRPFVMITHSPAEALAPYGGFALLGIVLAGSWLLARWLDIPVRHLLGRWLLNGKRKRGAREAERTSRP
jgi:peptidoglycan/LPS O-acetylase OafA/YrhL